MAPRGAPRRAPVPGAREGAPRLRVAAHLPCRRPPRARLLPPLHASGVDGPAGLRRRGVLDRRLLRHRRPLPERDPADDDRVQGRRVDQGDDDPRLAADRARLPRRRGAPDRRAGERPVLPRARRLAAGDRRQPPLRRRLPAPDRGGVALSGAGARPRRRRAAGSDTRRVPGGRRDDALLLAAHLGGR